MVCLIPRSGVVNNFSISEHRYFFLVTSGRGNNLFLPKGNCAVLRRRV
jgi:hypothetical protein